MQGEHNKMSPESQNTVLPSHYIMLNCLQVNKGSVFQFDKCVYMHTILMNFQTGSELGFKLKCCQQLTGTTGHIFLLIPLPLSSFLN